MTMKAHLEMKSNSLVDGGSETTNTEYELRTICESKNSLHPEEIIELEMNSLQLEIETWDENGNASSFN